MYNNLTVHWWMDKNVAHTHNRILFNHKRYWNLAIQDNMGGPPGHYARWNKAERERGICIILLTCGI